MTTKTRNNRQAIITASEVGEFVFCAKAWQLKRDGATLQSPHLKPGEVFHERHSARVSLAWRLRRTGWILIWVAILLFIALALMPNVGTELK